MNDVVKKTIEAYEEKAEEYSETRLTILPNVKEIADFFIRHLKGRRILDVGCGNGRDALYFTEKGFEVTGIDAVKTFIKIAKSRVPKAEFKLMDLRKLEFPDNNFDGVWASASLLHIPKSEAKQTIEGFKRVLKPSGILFIGVKQGEGERFVQEDNMERFFAYYSKDEIEKLIGEAGFRILQTTIIEKGDAIWIRTVATKAR